MSTRWNSKPEFRMKNWGILIHSFHPLFPHFLSGPYDSSVYILCAPSFLSHSSATSHTTQAVTLLPHYAAFPDLHAVLPVTPTSHSQSALLPHVPLWNNSQRRLKSDFLSPTIRGALILISHSSFHEECRELGSNFM